MRSIEDRLNELEHRVAVLESRKSRKVFIVPKYEELVSYCRENNLTVDCKFFLKYFTESGWVDKNGVAVRSWKQKLLTWSKNTSGIQPISKSKGVTTSIEPAPSRVKQKEDERIAMELFEAANKQGIKMKSFKEYIHGNNNKQEQNKP